MGARPRTATSSAIDGGASDTLGWGAGGDSLGLLGGSWVVARRVISMVSLLT